MSEKKLRVKYHAPLKSIESVVLSESEHSVLSIHSYDRPDAILELPTSRTDFIVHLLGSVEANANLHRFKLGFASKIYIKEKFTLKNIESTVKPVEEAKVVVQTEAPTTPAPVAAPKQ